MPIRIVPYSEREIPGVIAFNQRMGADQALTDFLLPETAPSPEKTTDRVIRKTQYLAVEEDFVRGGFLLVAQPAWVNGQLQAVLNFQSLLSEGIRDKRYALVAMQMLKYIQQQGDRIFVVGMGSDTSPLPRLLKASHWSLEPVPFLFRVHRVNRVLRHLPLLHGSKLRASLASVAALSGLGWLGIELLQSRRVFGRLSASGVVIEPVDEWGPWADQLWEDFRPASSFAVARDREALQDLYPNDDSRILRFLLRKDSRPVGWAACFNTLMTGHTYFGDLRVGTILDCVAHPDAMEATAELASAALASYGADLVVTNQAHRLWLRAFRQAGFLSFRSNYLLAMSAKLTQEIAARPGGPAAIHLTRGDGDGRIHL
jgi:hypothetical protein